MLDRKAQSSGPPFTFSYHAKLYICLLLGASSAFDRLSGVLQNAPQKPGLQNKDGIWYEMKTFSKHDAYLIVGKAVEQEGWTMEWGMEHWLDRMT